MFSALEVAVRRKLGEDPVRETDDVQADLELEVVADLPSTANMALGRENSHVFTLLSNRHNPEAENPSRFKN
jgi:hypothetical protein